MLSRVNLSIVFLALGMFLSACSNGGSGDAGSAVSSSNSSGSGSSVSNGSGSGAAGSGTTGSGGSSSNGGSSGSSSGSSSTLTPVSVLFYASEGSGLQSKSIHLVINAYNSDSMFITNSSSECSSLTASTAGWVSYATSKSWTLGDSAETDGKYRAYIRHKNSAGVMNSVCVSATFSMLTDPPTVSLSSTSLSTVTGAFVVKATFSKAVTGFSSSAVTVTNSTVTSVATVSTSVYNITVTPSDNGQITVVVPSSVVVDSGNRPNSSSNTITRTAASIPDTANPSDPTNFTVGASTTSATTAPSATWTASTDNRGVDHYEVAIGSSSGATDVLSWTNVGNVTSTTLNSGFTLSNGVTYYTSIKALDVAGNSSNVVTSSSWAAHLPDTTPPTGPSQVGVPDMPAPPGRTPTAWWYDGSDDVGVDHYEMAVGTTSGGTDVSNWTSVGLVLSGYLSGLNLVHGSTYYTSVRAVDAAGNNSSGTNSDAWVYYQETSSQDFYYSSPGSVQTFVVPQGVTSIRVDAWGGGGGYGGSMTYSCSGSYGGGGAWITTTIAVTPGESLSVLVAGGGRDGGNGGLGGYGGGGRSGEGGGGGGGRSEIGRDSDSSKLVIAGGGGGGGCSTYANSQFFTGHSVRGGAATDTVNGRNGQATVFWMDNVYFNQYDQLDAYGGRGGSSSSGGAGAVGGYVGGLSGSLYQGADGVSYNGLYTGAGGAGYYGGGSGTMIYENVYADSSMSSQISVHAFHGGGGGSSYFTGQGILYGGGAFGFDAYTAGNWKSGLLINGAANAGNGGYYSDGHPGYIHISWH